MSNRSGRVPPDTHERPYSGVARLAMESAATVCIANIGPRERRKRMVVGAVAGALGLLGAAALVALGAPRWVRLVLFAPFVVGAAGVFQARAQT